MTIKNNEDKIETITNILHDYKLDNKKKYDYL